MDYQNAQTPIPATAPVLSEEQTDTPSEVDNNVPLSPDEEIIFDKYAHKYGISKGVTNENVDRQRYVYSALNSKGIDNTAVERLLDLTISDINHQYTMKNAMESKTGFLVALWGVLLGIVLNNKLHITLISEISSDSSTLAWSGLNVFVLLGLIVTALGALVQIAQTLLAGKYFYYKFDNKEVNFKCAVDDKNMMFTKLLDANTNAWKKNEETNDKKYIHLRNSVIWIFSLIFFIVISISVQLFIEETNNMGEKDISVKIHMEGVNNDEETVQNQAQYETSTTE